MRTMNDTMRRIGTAMLNVVALSLFLGNAQQLSRHINAGFDLKLAEKSQH